MTTEKIKKELKAAGKNQRVIAQQLGVSQASVSLVISGRSVSERIMLAISEAIGRHVSCVFPDWYNNRIVENVDRK